MKNLNKRGGKGMLPVGCLPLWGREGVTLLAAAENKRITQKKRISTKPKFITTVNYYGRPGDSDKHPYIGSSIFITSVFSALEHFLLRLLNFWENKNPSSFLSFPF
jgi:hypothetical protein